MNEGLTCVNGDGGDWMDRERGLLDNLGGGFSGFLPHHACQAEATVGTLNTHFYFVKFAKVNYR